PLALLEAEKCGCIPICSAVGGMLYKVRGIGELIYTASAMDYKRAILKYASFSEDQIDGARRKIKQDGAMHSIENMVNEIIGVWKS
ncbi:glycosyltransferase, partial [Patescibacteria group bacterium]|nr:glycosyltransferase [Patescibacteria group bacterium]